MHTANSSRGRLVLFPGKSVLSRQEAVQYLGVSTSVFLALRTLRCGPSSRQLDGRKVYREEELEQFKTNLLSTVGVSHAEATPYRATQQDPAAKSAPSQPDPLMQLLARAAIRHRVILLSLWGMMLAGGFITLILF